MRKDSSIFGKLEWDKLLRKKKKISKKNEIKISGI
jgi:hypothetical protein